MIHLPVLLIVVPLLAAALVFFGHRFSLIGGRAVLALLSAFGLTALAGLAVMVGLDRAVAYEVGGWSFTRGIVLAADPLSLLMLGLIQVVFLAVVLFPFPAEEEESTAYSTFLCLLQAGLNGMVLTADLFNLYVALEITSIVSYALVAYPRSRESLEAGFKYLVLGTVGSLLVLWGIGLIYAAAGNLNLAWLSRTFGEAPPALRAAVLALLVAGFALKAGVVPFHAWKPDAYGAAPGPVSAVLGGVVGKVPLYCLLRIVALLYGGPDWSAQGLGPVLVWMGFATVLVGHAMALRQDRLGRLLAWSSVAHIGYIVVALGTATPRSVAGGLFHLVNHGLLKAGLFLVTGEIVLQRGSDRIGALRGLVGGSPGLVVVFVLLSLGMVGIPPLNGFLSKWAIVMPVMRAGYIVPAASVVAGGLIALLYYTRVVAFMCLPGPGAARLPGPSRGKAGASPGLLALLSLGIFFLGDAAFRLMTAASRAVFQPQPYLEAILRSAAP